MTRTATKKKVVKKPLSKKKHTKFAMVSEDNLAAPKRNRSGAPGKYESAVALDNAIEAYDLHCRTEVNKKGKRIQRSVPLMPNKAGLCLFLNISRETYSQYRKKFPDTIKSADHWIEESWVQRLRSNAPTGAIFYLKNAFKETYKDRHQTDLTTKGEKIETFNESQLERIAHRLLNGNAPSKA